MAHIHHCDTRTHPVPRVKPSGLGSNPPSPCASHPLHTRHPPPRHPLPCCCATLLRRLLPPVNTKSCTGPLTKKAPLQGHTRHGGCSAWPETLGMRCLAILACACGPCISTLTTYTCSSMGRPSGPHGRKAHHWLPHAGSTACGWLLAAPSNALVLPCVDVGVEGGADVLTRSQRPRRPCCPTQRCCPTPAAGAPRWPQLQRRPVQQQRNQYCLKQVCTLKAL